MLWPHSSNGREGIFGGLEAGVILVAIGGGMTVAAVLPWTCGSGVNVDRAGYLENGWSS
jgi:hypothetical protein